jgi:recombination protein RecA
LDFAIANKPNGGVPVGRITELSGKEGSGKSLLAYHVMSNTQKRGGIAVYIDTERAFNEEFMKRMGVDTTPGKFIRPKKTPGSIEEVFEYIEKVVEHTRLKMPNKNRLVTVVWDSVAATPGREELEVAHTETPRLGTEARAMSRSLRKVIGAIDAGYVTLVCINQLREKIGVSFGDPDVTSHGKSLPFYASVRVKLKSLKQAKDIKADRTIGVFTQASVFKNKVGPNHRKVDFPLYFDFGVGDEASWLEFMKDLGHVETGVWSTLKFNEEEIKFQSIGGWCELMNTREDVRKFVLDTIAAKMIITFEHRPESVDIDTESLMEVESLKQELGDLT